MNILLVSKAYFPHLGGVETVVRQLAEGMRKLGHETAVLCFGDRDVTEELNGVTVRRVRPAIYVGSAPVGRRFVSEFFRMRRQADVVNFHAPNPMGEIAFLLSPALRGKKTVCTYHGDAQRPEFLLPAYDAALRRFLRRCDAVVISSPPLSKSSRVLLRAAAEDNIHVIPLGVRTEDYGSTGEDDLKEALRLLNQLPEASFKVMYAGRMVYYKGLDVLLEAALKIKKHGSDGSEGRAVSMFLVGSGPEESGVGSFIAKNGLENDVLVLPHQPDGVYRALFTLADCFVLPSTHRTEAYGIVLAEAMASGVPLVSTELGTGTSWLNRDGETGIVIPPGDPDALAKAFLYLATHEEERKAMAAAALARARHFFDEKTMLDAYDGLFRALMNEMGRVLCFAASS